MKDFSRGVSWYAKGTVEIGFPEGDCCCWWCPLMDTDYGSKRERCSKTGEILLAPKHMIGELCPINFEVSENDDLA